MTTDYYAKIAGNPRDCLEYPVIFGAVPSNAIGRFYWRKTLGLDCIDEHVWEEWPTLPSATCWADPVC